MYSEVSSKNHISKWVPYVEVGLQPPINNKLGKNSFCETSFQVGMDLWKVQKQGRDEKARKKTILLQNNGRKEKKEDYPTKNDGRNKDKKPTLHHFFP